MGLNLARRFKTGCELLTVLFSASLAGAVPLLVKDSFFDASSVIANNRYEFERRAFRCFEQVSSSGASFELDNNHKLVFENVGKTCYRLYELEEPLFEVRFLDEHTEDFETVLQKHYKKYYNSASPLSRSFSFAILSQSKMFFRIYDPEKYQNYKMSIFTLESDFSFSDPQDFFFFFSSDEGTFRKGIEVLFSKAYSTKRLAISASAFGWRVLYLALQTMFFVLLAFVFSNRKNEEIRWKTTAFGAAIFLGAALIASAFVALLPLDFQLAQLVSGIPACLLFARVIVFSRKEARQKSDVAS